jgi:hypothetical protein
VFKYDVIKNAVGGMAELLLMMTINMMMMMMMMTINMMMMMMMAVMTMMILSGLLAHFMNLGVSVLFSSANKLPDPCPWYWP